MSDDHSNNSPSNPSHSSSGPSGTEPPNGKTPAAPQGEMPKGVLVRRPWLPVTLAVIVAALLLLFFLIPGVLLYPERQGLFTSSEEELNAQREINRSIEEQIARLKRELEEGVCVWDGQFWLQPPPPYPDNIPPAPRPSQNLPPAAPNATPLQETALPPGTDSSGSLLDLLDQSTVLILASGEEGFNIGSGFVVAPGKILTNSHVIGGSDSAQVAIANQRLGQVREARITAITPTSDIGQPDYALLDADTGNLPPLSFQPNVTRLENVVAAGFPAIILDTDEAFLRLMQGDAQSIPAAAVTEGNVNAIQPHGPVQIILHSAQITPGNSGGPLLDRCGRVLGVNTFVRDEETSARLNYALDADSAIAFLKTHGIQASVMSNACVMAPPPTPRGLNAERPQDEGESEPDPNQQN